MAHNSTIHSFPDNQHVVMFVLTSAKQRVNLYSICVDKIGYTLQKVSSVLTSAIPRLHCMTLPCLGIQRMCST